MQRFERAYAIDIETCPECGGKLRVIACIEEALLIAKILGHVQQCRAARGQKITPDTCLNARNGD
jgi:hypothetical protein